MESDDLIGKFCEVELVNERNISFNSNYTMCDNSQANGLLTSGVFYGEKYGCIDIRHPGNPLPNLIPLARITRILQVPPCSKCGDTSRRKTYVYKEETVVDFYCADGCVNSA
jgi:hypothetical protein